MNDLIVCFISSNRFDKNFCPSLKQKYSKMFVNKNVIVMLKDREFLFGVMKSYDQYNNISLNYTVKRIFLENTYAEEKIGLTAIRGENILSIIEAEFDKRNLQMVEWDTIKSKMEEDKLNKLYV